MKEILLTFLVSNEIDVRRAYWVNLENRNDKILRGKETSELQRKPQKFDVTWSGLRKRTRTPKGYHYDSYSS